MRSGHQLYGSKLYQTSWLKTESDDMHDATYDLSTDSDRRMWEGMTWNGASMKASYLESNGKKPPESLGLIVHEPASDSVIL
nr:hypothetical protein CFP56_30997 [Quercus suber]